MINKAIAAALTIGFMWAVRPDAGASKVGIALTAVLIYEGLTYCIGYIRKARKKDRYIKSVTISQGDIRRWAGTRLYWPIEEVR